MPKVSLAVEALPQGLTNFFFARLDDYLKRKILLQQVEVEMLKKKLIGFLEMVYLRKKYLAMVTDGALDTQATDRYNAGVLSGVIPKIDITSTDDAGPNRTLPMLQPPPIITTSTDRYGGEECESPIRGRPPGIDDDDEEIGASTSTSYNQHLTVKSTSPRRGSRGGGYDSSNDENYD